MREMPHIRKTIDAIKQCNIKNLDEFIQMVLYVTTHGSQEDMKKMANICAYILEKNNFFNRGGKKYLARNDKKSNTSEVAGIKTADSEAEKILEDNIDKIV